MNIKYKIIGENDITQIEKCFFQNRGIINPQEYKNLDESCVIDYKQLDNIDKAVELFIKNVRKKVHIVIDCDVDGITSAAMVYDYIKTNYNNVPTYSYHDGKEHGLSPDIMRQIPEDTEFLIIPDAGTNDVGQCKELSEKNIKILILDHHIKEKENPYAVIINNQTSNCYMNKEFCGAGIVYKFLKAVDDAEWFDGADKYLDLVALGNISDVMDMHSYETRYLTQKGLENIKNPAFKAFLANKQDKFERGVTINDIAFYVTPTINAVCRVGTDDDKNILFRAFAGEREVFAYKPRKNSPERTETIFERAARLADNAKKRQSGAVDKILVDLKEQVEHYKVYDNTVMFVKMSAEISGSFTGLIAMKSADLYKRPCVVLREKDGVYSGSARNFENSSIENLKKVLESTELFNFCQGHENAFGVEIKSENIKLAIQKLNELQSPVERYLSVDFCLKANNLSMDMIFKINELKPYFATGIKEPSLLVTDIVLSKDQCKLMGSNETTWKFTNNENIEFVKFRIDDDDPIKYWLKSDLEHDLIITVYGKASINAFGGLLTPQIIIESYEVI